MGLTLQELDVLTPVEYVKKVEGFKRRRDDDFHRIAVLERQNTAIISSYAGHLKKGLDPRQLYRLPGERQRRDQDYKPPTKEEVLQKIKDLNKRIKKP